VNEDGMWDGLRPRLQALGLHPVRVENTLGEGTPDVNYISGWVELKWLEAWPARASTLVRLRKLEERPAQVNFLTERWRLGGQSWLMLRVGREALLFSGWSARAVRAGRLREELEALAIWRSNSHGAFERQPLLAALTWDMEALPAPTRAKLWRHRFGKTTQETADLLGIRAAQVDLAEAEESSLTHELIEYWTA
jgi:hypothetical protein